MASTSALEPIISAPYVFEATDDQVQRTPYGHFRHALRYRAFFRYWVRRSLVTRYRQTSLGWLWALLQPLISSLIYGVVFSVIVKVDTRPIPFPLFIITNLVFWSYFSRVVLVGSGSVTGNIELLTHIQFPREFLPLAVWVESLVDLGVGLLIIGAGFLLFGYPLTIYAPIALIAILIESMLALGLAFLLASMTVLVRDLLQVAPLIMQFLLYLSPIIYPLTNVPASVRALFLINPLGPIFVTIQDALFSGRFTMPGQLAVAGVISVIVLLGGYVVFKRVEWQFADLL